MKFEAFVHCVHSTVLENGEVVYSALSFMKALQDTKEELCVSENGAAFVPQYIANNRRMELYWFELNIDDEYPAETFLLSKTGKRNIHEISREVLELYDICHLAVCPPHRTVSKALVLRYFNELLSRKDITEGIARHFGSFDAANMYVSVF